MNCGIILGVDDERGQVAKMVAPRWLPGGSTDETVVYDPSRRQVEQAIRHLDGEEFHGLFLYPGICDVEAFLGIGGGAGRYFVGISDHAERAGQVLNTQDPSDVCEDVMCGGQVTSIPRRFLVDLQTAVTAAVHYLDTGAADPTLSWDWR
jgi:Immunity protein Imm1